MDIIMLAFLCVYFYSLNGLCRQRQWISISAESSAEKECRSGGKQQDFIVEGTEYSTIFNKSAQGCCLGERCSSCCTGGPLNPASHPQETSKGKQHKNNTELRKTQPL